MPTILLARDVTLTYGASRFLTSEKERPNSTVRPGASSTSIAGKIQALCQAATFHRGESVQDRTSASVAAWGGPSEAKAHLDGELAAARLKPCPDTRQLILKRPLDAAVNGGSFSSKLETRNSK